VLTPALWESCLGLGVDLKCLGVASEGRGAILGETERQRQSERDRETETERQTQRDRERDRERAWVP